jgi:23S rRNA pseudouridine1911/1915/1917 synthase
MRPLEPLTILWDDPHLLAVIKPAGLLTQGVAGGEPTLEDAVRRYLRPDDPGSVYVGTVHRLDRPVSGVVVWARTPKAARRVADQFARGEARKEYWAVVEGGPAGSAEERWDDWLGPVGASGLARVVTEDSPGARRAITRARPIAGARCPAGMAFLALEPETGRTHQLRVQSASRRRPIAGDSAYGSTFAFPRGIALHARRLTFEHPVSKRAITLVAPLPEEWALAGVAPPET